MTRRILYCHCAYAKVVPAEVKREVLRRLGRSDVPFDAVPDLCEMTARKDEALAAHEDDPELEIVACYPRAVRWLYHGAGRTLAEETRVHNMREAGADEILAALGVEEGAQA